MSNHLDHLEALPVASRITAYAEAEREAREGLAEVVAWARQAGWTWARIGDALGTTRQSAQERYGR